MKKQILFIIFLLGTLPIVAQVDLPKPYEQASFYLYLDSVQGLMEQYSHMRAQMGNPLYTEDYGSPEHSIVFKQKTGHFYYKDWYNGIRIYTADMWYSVPLQPDKGGNMKNRPTNNRQFNVTSDYITFRFYNDMQTYPNLKETADGTVVVRPQDMFASQFHCKAGTRTENVQVFIGKKVYTCKMQVTCQHKDYSLSVTAGARQGAWINGKWHSGAIGGNVERSSDYLSPWKFTHVVTYTLDLNTLAKAMAMSRTEMAQTIIAAGGIYPEFLPIRVTKDVFEFEAGFGAVYVEEEQQRWETDLFCPMNAMLLSTLKYQTGLSQQQMDEMRTIAFQQEKEHRKREEQLVKEKHLEELRNNLLLVKKYWKDYYDRGVKARADSVIISEPYTYRRADSTPRLCEAGQNLVAPLLLDTALIYSKIMMNIALELNDTIEYNIAVDNLYKSYRQQYYSFYVDQNILKHVVSDFTREAFGRCRDAINASITDRIVVSMGLADIEHLAGNDSVCVELYLEAKHFFETNKEDLKKIQGSQNLIDSINYKLSKSILDYLDNKNDIDGLNISTPYAGINDLLAMYPNKMEYIEQKGRIMLRYTDNKFFIRDWWKQNILSVDPNYANKETIFYKELIKAGVLKEKKKK